VESRRNRLLRRTQPKIAVIIAPETDLHAQVVATRLREIGGEPILLDSAEFPTRWRLSIELSLATRMVFSLQYEDKRINGEDVAGVWWRRPKRHLPSEQIAESHLRRFAEDESTQAFDGWLLSLGAKVINPIGAEWIADHKLYQLKCAMEVGLRIPKTLITNTPSKAREFRLATSATVFKPFTGTSWQFTGTQRMSTDALNHLEHVKHAPIIFQEEISKIADVRATIIDDYIFSVSIRAKGDSERPLDWRSHPHRQYESHTMDSETTSALFALMRMLNLRFGACDLALMDDGKYYFLEVNPGGQWLFVEIMGDQPVSQAMAQALLNPPLL
jgi:hypothetical protein